MRQAPAPEAARAPDHVLPQPALRLVPGARGAAGERRALERGVDLVLVEPVAELVQRRVQRVHVGLVVARRQAHVGHGDRRLERMGRLVEAPLLLVDADRAQHGAQQRALAGLGERAHAQQGVVDLRRRGHERDEAVAQALERVAHLGRGHARLVVVEQRVVGVLGLGEARAVAPAQLDVALQEGREGREVVGLARLHPRAARGHARRGPSRPRARRGRARALSKSRRATRTMSASSSSRGAAVGQQLADALVGEALVGQAPDRGAHLPARLAAARAACTPPGPRP